MKNSKTFSQSNITSKQKCRIAKTAKMSENVDENSHSVNVKRENMKNLHYCTTIKVIIDESIELLLLK